MVSAGAVLCVLRSPIGAGSPQAAPHHVHTNPNSQELPKRTRDPQEAFKPVCTNEPEPCSESEPMYGPPGAARRGDVLRPRIPTVPWTTRTRG
jgi:hypothetical protein